MTPIERKSSIGRIQNSVDPRGIDSIFHGAPMAGSTLPSDPVYDGISASLQQAEDRMAEKLDVNNLAMSET